jgi:hypothetical protein
MATCLVFDHDVLDEIDGLLWGRFLMLLTADDRTLLRPSDAAFDTTFEPSTVPRPPSTHINDALGLRAFNEYRMHIISFYDQLTRSASSVWASRSRVLAITLSQVRLLCQLWTSMSDRRSAQLSSLEARQRNAEAIRSARRRATEALGVVSSSAIEILQNELREDGNDVARCRERVNWLQYVDTRSGEVTRQLSEAEGQFDNIARKLDELIAQFSPECKA